MFAEIVATMQVSAHARPPAAFTWTPPRVHFRPSGLAPIPRCSGQNSIFVPHISVLLAPLAALALTLAPPAFAENVRLQDVESPTLRAGLEAATSGRLEVAERFFKAYLASEDPESASAFSNLGNVHLQMGRPEQAVQDFSRAIALAPEAPVPLLNRAIAFEQLGVDAQSSGDSTKATGLWERAVEDCNAAIERDPKEFAAFFDKGNVQMRLADWPGALDSFTRAADLAPGLAGYRLRAATLLFQTGDSQRAQQQVRGLVRKYGNYAEAHAVLAAMQWADGAQELAEEQLSRATELDDTWGDKAAVERQTRWPPALYAAYSKLLSIT